MCPGQRGSGCLVGTFPRAGGHGSQVCPGPCRRPLPGSTLTLAFQSCLCVKVISGKSWEHFHPGPSVASSERWGHVHVQVRVRFLTQCLKCCL